MFAFADDAANASAAVLWSCSLVFTAFLSSKIAISFCITANSNSAFSVSNLIGLNFELMFKYSSIVIVFLLSKLLPNNNPAIFWAKFILYLLSVLLLVSHCFTLDQKSFL